MSSLMLPFFVQYNNFNFRLFSSLTLNSLILIIFIREKNVREFIFICNIARQWYFFHYQHSIYSIVCAFVWKLWLHNLSLYISIVIFIYCENVFILCIVCVCTRWAALMFENILFKIGTWCLRSCTKISLISFA